MERIDLQDFLKFVRTQEGQVLRTLKRDKPFTVRVTKTGVEYTPQSTMKERPHQTKFMERVLEILRERFLQNNRLSKVHRLFLLYFNSHRSLYCSERGGLESLSARFW